MHIPSIIETKRDGGVLGDEEIRSVIGAYTAGEMPDYQMSALSMAIYFNGMTMEETASLTRAMLDSGEVFEYPESGPRVVDKHSTGGIGDKVSLVLAPLLACDELWVPMISGRGLGITGGTLDKLEAIPGFRVGLSREEAMAQLEKTGVVMMGQTADVCPADKKLYALRDVTATVPSQPLIVASIMSKKLAETLDALVLDVKFGSGAFMKTGGEAESLGSAMQAVGEAMGVDTRVCYHTMDEPLGRAVGNALEVVESIETLKGGGPEDLRRIVIALAKEVSSADESQLEGWLDDGNAWRKFQGMVDCQGGDSGALEKLVDVQRAPVIRDITAEHDGIIIAVDAETIGRCSVSLGAGRSKADDVIDPTVGFDQLIKVGTEVSTGDVLGRVHATDEAGANLGERALREAIRCE
ncbi:MAG: thymidine phosphorylase [Verrucomicrobiales bacterium]|nr:thymidine phosphorylase [Verrucomicrobiales bacterium]